jgi:hypothetical protein
MMQRFLLSMLELDELLKRRVANLCFAIMTIQPILKNIKLIATDARHVPVR